MQHFLAFVQRLLTSLRSSLPVYGIRALEVWGMLEVRFVLKAWGRRLRDASVFGSYPLGDGVAVNTRSVLTHPLTINLISFFLLSFIAFRHNSLYLFYGYDGKLEVSLLTLGFRFTPPIFGLTNDFIHGLGNVSFAINPWFIPSYLISASAPGGFVNYALPYAICATDLFIATYLAARMADCSRFAALGAAWLLPLLVFQYAGGNLIPNTFRAFPHFAMIAGVSTLVAAMLLQISRVGRSTAAILAVLCFLGVSYIVLVAPTLLILAAPELVVFGGVSLAASWREPHFFFKLGAVFAVPVVCVALGYAHYVLGLVDYTAAAFFRGLSLRTAGLHEVSMLFWRPFYWSLDAFHLIERSFVGLGLVGAIWTGWRGVGLQRLAAAALLIVEALYLSLGIAHFYHPFWFGPSFWYFEGYLFPYHAIFIVLFATEAVCTLARFASSFWSPHLLRNKLILRSAAVGLAVAIAIVPWVYVRHEQKIVGPPNLPRPVPYRQPETPITRIIKKAIALRPGAPFRGRVASLTGRIFSTKQKVDLGTIYGEPNVMAWRKTGNSHAAAGFWQDAVPTLLEYNQLMTPAYFVFVRTFFTEPVDRQIRNLIAMRRIDPRMLAAVGVRFVVTDAPYPGLRELQKIDVPVGPADLRRLRGLGLKIFMPSFALHLYELDNPNLGQFSPTEQRVTATVSEMLGILADPAVDLSKTIVVSHGIEGPLVPAHLEAFQVDRGRFRIRATSKGRSVLVLPMEFSRCLTLRPDNGKASKARLFRADLLMTGVLFEKNLDATISYRTGPVFGSRCRLRDAADVTAIKIGDAFRSRPELLPKQRF